MRSRRLLESTLLYFVANASSRVLSFIFLPLYSTYISPADYGEFDLISTALIVLIPVFFINIWMSAIRFMLDRSIADHDQVLATSWAISLISAVTLTAACFILMSFVPIKYGTYAVLLGLSQAYVLMFQFTIRGLQLHKVFALSGIFATLVGLVANLVFIVLFRWGVQALFLSSILSSLAVIGFCEYKAKVLQRIIIRKFDVKLARMMVAYSGPLILENIAHWLLLMFNRFVLFFWLGAEANGYLAVANKFVTLLVVVNSVLYRTWQEETVLELNASDKERYYSELFSKYINVELSLVTLFIPLCYILFSYIVNPAYGSSRVLIPLLLLSGALNTTSDVYGTYLMVKGRTLQLAATTLIGAAVSVVTMLVVVSSFGLYAIGISSILGFITTLFSRVIVGRAVLKLKIAWLGPSTILLLLIITFYFYYTQNIPANTLLLVFVMVVSLFVNRDTVVTVFRLGKVSVSSFRDRATVHKPE